MGRICGVRVGVSPYFLSLGLSCAQDGDESSVSATPGPGHSRVLRVKIAVPHWEKTWSRLSVIPWARAKQAAHTGPL